MKFLIIGHARCGSHMLATLLDSHPDIKCFGEVSPNGRRRPWLEWKHYSELQDGEGGIMHYRELGIKELPELPEFKVIHLHRDFRKMAISWWLAGAKRPWDMPIDIVPTHTTESYDIQEGIEVDEEAIHKIIAEIVRVQYVAFFVGDKPRFDPKQILHVSYDWLTENKSICELPVDKSKVLCDFLGVENHKLTTILHKTNTKYE